MPLTYCINEENWQSVLSSLSNQYGKNNKKDKNEKDLIWILKPSLLNNGQHIKVFENLKLLKEHYMSSNRMGGEHVLQQYIAEPHLLNGFKYSIRLFLVLTNYAGAYLYPKGYFNIAKRAYTKNDFSDLSPHITNEHLKENDPNVIQVPILCSNSFQPIYLQIKKIISSTLLALKNKHPNAFVLEQKRTLAIFGVDFLVDKELRAWLLEANHGPCFPTSDEHPLQQHLYEPFWDSFIQNFAKPVIDCSSPWDRIMDPSRNN